MADKNETFRIKANEYEFTFTKEQIEAADIIQKSPVEFNLLKNHQSVNAKLIETDATSKNSIVEVEGENFAVEIKDEMDQMLDKMGFGAVAGKHIKEIKAPMPGLVLEVAVSEGQEVKEGEKILILVAMKMENSIMIHSNATIKRIAVKAGQAVDKGQLLVELD